MSMTGALLGVFAGVAWAAGAIAQGFPIPGKSIRIVIPFPPGGQTDVHARLIAPRLSEALGVAVIVENRPGAASFIAAQEVARAAPDGHTIFYTSLLTHTQNPHLYSKLPYDPFMDFTPIMQFVSSALALVSSPQLPANNLQELVAHARANPGKVNYASVSQGSTSHLYAEILKSQAGIDIVHIPYKGTADAMRDLYGNQVQILFDGPVTAVQNLKAGRVKVLAVTGSRRLPALPEVPTAAEQGVPGMELVGWIGFFGPGGMARETVARINAELVRISKTPEMIKVVVDGGLEPAANSPDQFTQVVKEHYERWGAVIRRIGLNLDAK